MSREVTEVLSASWLNEQVKKVMDAALLDGKWMFWLGLLGAAGIVSRISKKKEPLPQGLDYQPAKITRRNIKELREEADRQSVIDPLGQKKKIGVLLVNLGTPNDALPSSVYTYLTQFLMDGRIVDLPYPFRFLLTRGIIVPFRYKTSTKNYQTIWLTEHEDYRGSPLRVHTVNILDKVRRELNDLSSDDEVEFKVELAMRYQYPSVEAGLHKLHVDQQCDHIVVFPLFPHYSSATVGSVHEECMRIVTKWRTIPNLHFINSYPTNKNYISAIVDKMTQDMTRIEKEMDAPFDHIVFTYHGLPESHIINADLERNDMKLSYLTQCLQTTQAIIKELASVTGRQITKEMYTDCFQR